MKTTTRGSCLCGRVRFEIDLTETSWMEHCHCSMCRKVHGASFVTWLDVALADFRLAAGADAVRDYRSSPPARRSFCGICGASLFWQRDGADELSIAVGVLDGDPGARPAAHIYVDSRAPWVELDDRLPKHPGARPR